MDRPNVAIIREELVELTGDYKKALILNQLIYWSTKIKDFDDFLEEEKNREKNIEVSYRNGWIYKTAEDLSKETMLGLSPSNIRSHIKELVKNGWVSERKNPDYRWDRTLQYRVDTLKVKKDLFALGYVANIGSSYTISKIEVGVHDLKIHDTQTEKAIPETTTERLKPIDIQGLNDTDYQLHSEQVEDEEDTNNYLDKEAAELLELMPNKLGFANFHLVYKDVRQQYSKEELFSTVERYKQLASILGNTIYYSCTNFFRQKHFLNFLDSNWSKTLEYAKQEANSRVKSRQTSKFKTKSNETCNEPEPTESWKETVDQMYADQSFEHLSAQLSNLLS